MTHAAVCHTGREDMDVRMLGYGRPFVMEVTNARAVMPSREWFTEAEKALNASGVGVEVRKLQPVEKAALKLIKACSLAQPQLCPNTSYCHRGLC